MNNTGDEYFEAFTSKIKTKTFEQFTLLLCDLSKATPEQKRLLGGILFENHRSPENWLQYLDYITTWFADRKLQIQRLYCKALELIPENELTKSNPKYLQIHLHVADMKSTIEDKCKYFEQTLQRKSIGIKLSNLYLTWGACLLSKDSIAEAVAIIEKGLQNGAEPRLLLVNQLKELYHVIKERTAKKRSVTCFDNGEVQFKRQVRRASDSSEDKNSSNDDGEMENEATEKIEPLPLTENTLTTTTTNEKKKAATSSKLTPRGLSGKCQRVIHGSSITTASSSTAAIDEPPVSMPIETNHIPSSTRTSTRSGTNNKATFSIFEDLPFTTTEPHPNKNEEVKEEGAKKKSSSSLKAKYIDDTLRNFNPVKGKTVASSAAVGINKAEGAGGVGVKIPSFLDNMGIIPTMILPSNPTQPSNMTSSNTAMMIEGVTSSSPSSMISNSTTATMKEEDATEKMPTHDLQQLLAQAPVIAQKLAAAEVDNNNKLKRQTSVSDTPIASMLSVEQSPMTVNGSKRKRVSFSADPVLPSAEHSEQQQRIKRTTSNSQQSLSAADGSGVMIFNDPSRQMTINNTQYIQLSLLGKGGSSSVHRVISSQDGAIYALKRVDVKDQEDSDNVLDSYCNEIRLLQSLKGTSPYIIDLIDHEVRKEDHMVVMILEAGDIDLAKLLNQRMKSAKQLASSVTNIAALDPIFTRLVWKEMLFAVNHIHAHRIVHGDLKPANFVFVKGHLKLIDFGIAKSFSTDTTNIYRESQIGTVNYMAPEAICPDSITRSEDDQEDAQDAEKDAKGKLKAEKAHYTMKLGRASDIWSLGCILYQMLYGRPPFANLNTIQKLAAIPNPNYTILYPEHEENDGIESVKACLLRQPKERMPISDLLEMSYLTIGNRNTSPVKTSNYANSSSFDQDNVKNVLTVLRKEALRMLGGNTSSSNNKNNSQQSKRVQAWFDSLNPEAIFQQSLVAANEEDNEDDEDTEEEVNDDDTTIKLPSSDDENEQQPASQQQQSSSASKPQQQQQGRKVLSNLTSSLINSRNNNTPSSASKKLVKKPTFVKSPVKVLPLSLQAQIATQALNLRSTKGQEGISNAEKWMKKKPSDDDPENQPMHVMLANRIVAMRKFMDLDQDNVTATESMDISGIHDFF